MDIINKWFFATILGALCCLSYPSLQAAASVVTPSKTTTKNVEYTLSIIKPNAVTNNHIGEIIARFEKKGLQIAAIKMVQLSQNQAEDFYTVHKDKPFFKDLVKFMVSGPVVIIALKGENAVALNREIMGATDPKKAAPGTIRADFAKSVTENSVHGSDSKENAQNEINFFFTKDEVKR